MKKYLISASILCLVLASCQQEEAICPADQTAGFKAVTEAFGEQTKTSLNENNSIEWSESDRIAIFQGCTIADVFEVTSASVGKTNGSFRQIRSEEDEGFISGTELSDNIAVYPYSDGLVCSNGKVTDDEVAAYRIENAVFPSVQYYNGFSFPENAFVMAAVTSGTSDRVLKFRNLSGALRLRIKGTASIVSISITGNDNEIISGEAEVLVYKDASAPSVEKLAGNGTVTLDCGDGVLLDEDEATEFTIALPPTVFEKGFTIRITDIEGVVDERTTGKNNAVKRSRVLNMPEITFGEDDSLPVEPQEGDYIDEYGVNHGQGEEIDGVVWAPVNCGYHETDFIYGKLYQWGRKYGQGYDGNQYDVYGNQKGTYADATVPTVKDGPVSLSTGQSENNEGYFYENIVSPGNWLSLPDAKLLWNNGTESDPVKTEYDPCPEGWRVPTYAELKALNKSKSSWTTDSEGQIGYWFSGSNSYSSSGPRVFFPAAGYRDNNNGDASNRGSYGYYWSSRLINYGYNLYFSSTFANMSYDSCASGFSVRCVQDDGELIKVTSLTLGKTSHTIEQGDTYTLSVTIRPSDANHQSAYWWSDDENVATVDQKGMVTAVSAGTATITAMAGMKTATCKVTVNEPEPEGPTAADASDLASGGENANCYIVSKSGDYKFKPVKGNGTESVGSVSSVEVLWESFGTSVTPSEGDLISEVLYDDGYVVFSTAETFREGNAVIAAKNSSGTILWSWHIWLTDEPVEQVYYNGAGTMMDRNLGATSATPGAVGALGLLYQWGRKDPFLGSSSISSNTLAKSTGSWPSAVSSSSSNGTIDYSVKNPMTFITSNTSNLDWYYSGSSSTNDTRWQSEKTIYDPCPAGWRVPDGGTEGVWSDALGSSSSFDYTYSDTNKGMNFSGKFGSAATIWYPASGYRYGSDGSLNYVGYDGRDWSVTPNNHYAYSQYFGNNDSVNPLNYYYRAVGLSVRCYKIGSTTHIDVEGVKIDQQSLELEIGDVVTLNAQVTPSDASDRSVVWSSSNTTVASVSQNGVVTALKAGTARITVRTNDGGYEDYCDIEVLSGFGSDDGKLEDDGDTDWD